MEWMVCVCMRDVCESCRTTSLWCSLDTTLYGWRSNIHPVPCTSVDVQNPSASKIDKIKCTFCKSLQPFLLTPVDFPCLVQNQNWLLEYSFIGSLSDQNSQLHSIINTVKSRNMYLFTLSESHWLGSGATSIRGTTILHSGTPSSYTQGVAILLHPRAKLAWTLLGASFSLCLNVSLRIHLKCHFLTYLSILFMLPLILPIPLPNLLVLMLSMTNCNQHFLLSLLWSADHIG